jgi:pimeloyl-ACP methyl ester carboxylesterase
MMDIRIKRDGGYEYVEEGSGPTIVLLHGLFGALSNWQYVLGEFSKDFHIIIPLMPIYKKTKVDASVEGLAEFIKGFLDYKGINSSVIMGNSLGGHIALIFTLNNRERVKALILTGSSGLFESGMGSTFPRRGDYEYIRKRVEFTFYDPVTASKDLIDEVFEIINDNYKALRIVKVARAAQRQNLHDEIATIRQPTLLVWGLNDNITPPNVAHEFHKLIPHSELRFIDGCGHAAMMERPHDFNAYLRQFLIRQNLHTTAH